MSKANFLPSHTSHSKVITSYNASENPSMNASKRNTTNNKSNNIQVIFNGKIATPQSLLSQQNRRYIPATGQTTDISKRAVYTNTSLTPKLDELSLVSEKDSVILSSREFK